MHKNSCNSDYASRGAMIYKSYPFISFSAIVIFCTYNYIAVTISIYIACAGNRNSKIRTGLVALYHSRSCSIYASSQAVIYKSHAFISLATIILPGTCYYIAVSIAIYIACTGNAITQLTIGLITSYNSRCHCVYTRCRAMIHKSSSLATKCSVVKWGTCNYIAIPIAIYIAGSCYRKTEPGINLIALHYGCKCCIYPCI